MFLRSLLFVFATTIALAQQAPQPPAQLKTAPVVRTHELPAGNAIQIDTEGRLRTHTIPGLAGKFVDYDADSRPVAVHLDGVLHQSFVYAQGRLIEQKVYKNGQLDVHYVYAYDALGRLITITEQLSGDAFSWTYVSDDDRRRDLIHTYTDANGIRYTYRYGSGNRVTRIVLAGGPAFFFDYDVAGNIQQLNIDGMVASFGPYQRGLPATMSWKYRDFAKSFTLSQVDGRLQAVTSDDDQLGLELTWSGDTLEEIVRHGPTFEERITPNDALNQLFGYSLSRSTGQVIDETTGYTDNRLLGGLTRNVDGQNLLDLTIDQDAQGLRLSGMSYAPTSGMPEPVLVPDYDAQGNLTRITRRTDLGAMVDDLYHSDALRRLTGVTVANGVQPIQLQYRYDPYYRRISAQESGRIGKWVYAYHGSRIIAAGVKLGGTINWVQAFGYGPTGPVMVRDITGHGQDAFILSDHLGTPFAYVATQDGAVRYTPFSPLGEALFDHPTPAPNFGVMPESQVIGVTKRSVNLSQGFDLPIQPPIPATSKQLGVLHAGFRAVPTLGLGGHPYDPVTGLTQMHHRAFHPRLGHFLTPDYRAPSLLDPSTFTLPYAYARGNPLLYRDLDGLKDLYFTVKGVYYGMEIDDSVWESLVTGMTVVDGRQLFDQALTFKMNLDWDPDTNLRAYRVYERAFNHRAKELEEAMILAFKTQALAGFQRIQGDIRNTLNGLNSGRRNALYHDLNQAGILPYLGADVVGRAHALEIAGFLAPHANRTYLQYGLSKDLEAGMALADILTFGAGAGRFAGGATRSAYRGIRSGWGRIPKPKFGMAPGGVMVDTMGRPHVSWPKFHLSFSEGGNRLGVNPGVKILDSLNLSKNQLISLATFPGKGGVSPVGRALQKHSARSKTAFTGATGNANNNTLLGSQYLRDIIFGDSTVTISSHKTLGSVIKIRLPDGQGAWFKETGEFIGFLEGYTPK